MDDKILKILKTGKLIEPSPEFKERSRRLLFAAPTPKKEYGFPAFFGLMENFRLRLALGTLGALLLAVLGVNYWQTFNQPNLNGQALKHEVENLDFQIQLQEIEYFENSAKEIAVILDDIKRAEPKEEPEINPIN